MTDSSNQRNSNAGAQQARPGQPREPAPQSQAITAPQPRRQEFPGRRSLFRN